jgi:hypothetical protein
VGHQDRDVVGPAVGAPDAVRDRVGEAGDDVRVLDVGLLHHPPRDVRQPLQPARVVAGGRGHRAVAEEHQRAALLDAGVAHRPARLRDRAQRRPGRHRQEGCAAVGVHDQRGRVAGGCVAELPRRRVENGVEDRRALDVVHLGGEVVERGEHRARRRVVERGRAQRPPQPAHRADSRDAVTDGVADDEGEPPGAEGDGVVPVATGGPHRRRRLVAAGQPQIGQQRQGRRQQRVLDLPDHAGERLGPQGRVGARTVLLQDQQHARPTGYAHRPEHDRGDRPLGPGAPPGRLGPPGAQRDVDQVGDRAAVEDGQVGAVGPERTGAGVGPDRVLVGGGQAVDRRRGVLHGLEQDRRIRRSGRRWRRWQTAVGGAHPRPGNNGAERPATAALGRRAARTAA